MSVFITRRGAPPSRVPIASTTASSGVTYADGLSGLRAETVSLFGEAISNNSAITNTTQEVYIDFGAIHRKVSIRDQVTLTIGGTRYAFDVIGFNHDTLTDAAAYGAATATGKAGMTLQMHDLFYELSVMNDSDTNATGWKNSYMRETYLTWVKHVIDQGWLSAMKMVDKTTSIGNHSDTIETVSDDLFLLSRIEVFTDSVHSAKGEGTRYAYYRSGGPMTKKWQESRYEWWCRSPYHLNTTNFCSLTYQGYANHVGAAEECGVSFAFCV